MNRWWARRGPRKNTWITVLDGWAIVGRERGTLFNTKQGARLAGHRMPVRKVRIQVRVK